MSADQAFFRGQAFKGPDRSVGIKTGRNFLDLDIEMLLGDGIR